MSTFSVKDAVGSPIGEIRCNYTKSWWKISDSSGEILATLHFDKNKGEIKTSIASFNVDYTDVYDSNSNLSLSVIGTKHERSKHAKLRIDSHGILSSFLACSISICITEQFLVYTPVSVD